MSSITTTGYYLVRLLKDDNLSHIKIPVIIEGRLLMPNNTIHQRKYSIEPDGCTLSSPVNYEIRRLRKYDSDYQKEYNYKIEFLNPKRLKLYLKLDIWQSIKINLIWDRYWINKDARLQLLVNTICFLAGIIVGNLLSIVKVLWHFIHY